jgi:UDP-N-acetylmuramate--alanine ligase
MSAIAIALAEMGHHVSGSDIRDRQVLDRLRSAGVTVLIGHRRDSVHGCDVVTYSTAIPSDLNELDEARRLGIPTVHRSEVLGAICRRATTLAVTGTHGKTTTTTMLMRILAEAGHEPGFVIGGDVSDLGTGARWTGSDWFVVEADESDGTHLRLPVHGSVLTNVDVDHLDNYGTFDAVVEGYARYLESVDGPRVVCVDDPVVAALADGVACIGYGMSEAARYRAVDIVASGPRMSFSVVLDGMPLVVVDLPLRGRHNVANATGAIALAVECGVDPSVAARALTTFGGVARRFDVRGVDEGATFVDDYAHLPAEISAVLSGVRESGEPWSRIIAVFQPNRFNRMAEISGDYASAFSAADVVVITDIYASGTEPIPGVTGKLVVDAVVDADPRRRVVWLPRRDDLVRFLADEVGDGDICISMGCGDVAALPDEVLVARRARRGVR